MALRRRTSADDHERKAAKEYDGDQRSGGKSERVVGQPIALYGIADLKLHHRHPGEAGREPSAGEVVVDRFLNLADDVVQTTARNDIRVKREHDQRQLTILRQQLAADDFVAHHALDQLVIFGAFG